MYDEEYYDDYQDNIPKKRHEHRSRHNKVEEKYNFYDDDEDNPNWYES